MVDQFRVQNQLQYRFKNFIGEDLRRKDFS